MSAWFPATHNPAVKMTVSVVYLQGAVIWSLNDLVDIFNCSRKIIPFREIISNSVTFPLTKAVLLANKSQQDVSWPRKSAANGIFWWGPFFIWQSLRLSSQHWFRISCPLLWPWTFFIRPYACSRIYAKYSEISIYWLMMECTLCMKWTNIYIT